MRAALVEQAHADQRGDLHDGGDFEFKLGEGGRVERGDVQAEHLRRRRVHRTAARRRRAEQQRHHREVVPLRHVPIEVGRRERQQVPL